MSDPIAYDPPYDPDFPATTPALTFDSGGADLLGVLHVPAGPGPHPVVVLLHGFPGNERNFDLAQALRRAGYAVIGHSLGGFAALMTAANDPSVAAVASVAGFDFGTAAARCRRTDPDARAR